MKAHLPGINARKEVATKKKDQTSGNNAECQEYADENRPMLHHAFESIAICAAEALELMFKAPLETAENVAGRLVRIVLMATQ